MISCFDVNGSSSTCALPSIKWNFVISILPSLIGTCKQHNVAYYYLIMIYHDEIMLSQIKKFSLVSLAKVTCIHVKCKRKGSDDHEISNGVFLFFMPKNFMIHSVLHYSIVLAAAAMCMYRNQPHPLHRPVPTPPTYIAHFFCNHRRMSKWIFRTRQHVTRWIVQNCMFV